MHSRFNRINPLQALTLHSVWPIPSKRATETASVPDIASPHWRNTYFPNSISLSRVATGQRPMAVCVSLGRVSTHSNSTNSQCKSCCPTTNASIRHWCLALRHRPIARHYWLVPFCLACHCSTIDSVLFSQNLNIEPISDRCLPHLHHIRSTKLRNWRNMKKIVSKWFTRQKERQLSYVVVFTAIEWASERGVWKWSSACLLTDRPHAFAPHFRHIHSVRSYSKSVSSNSAGPFGILVHWRQFSLSMGELLNALRRRCTSTARFMCEQFDLFLLSFFSLSSDDDDDVDGCGSPCLRFRAISLNVYCLSLFVLCKSLSIQSLFTSTTYKNRFPLKHEKRKKRTKTFSDENFFFFHKFRTILTLLLSMECTDFTLWIKFISFCTWKMKYFFLRKTITNQNSLPAHRQCCWPWTSSKFDEWTKKQEKDSNSSSAQIVQTISLLHVLRRHNY